MRPASLDEMVGQAHLLGSGRALSRLTATSTPHSMILWGPPGTGKTTLARLVARTCDARFESLSAVLAGVKDIRQIVERARQTRSATGKPTVLFLDEVHRFNKSQQDTFLPFVEDGTLVFIGATTENPSFEVNAALLSRARVYVLKPIGPEDLLKLLQRALTDGERGLGADAPEVEAGVLELFAEAADGDARRALNLLEIAADLAVAEGGRRRVTMDVASDVVAGGHRRFDKRGEQFYDQISALHKSVRGSDPDAALYWLARMLVAGEDPLFIARRLVRMANEDIGLADPQAIVQAIAAKDTYDFLGSPEGELALAQACVYLATAPKSIGIYTAYKAAMRRAKETGSVMPPKIILNAPTKMMKEQEYGSGYKYDPDQPDSFSGQNYFPPEMGREQYYDPPDRGFEREVRKRLAWWSELRKQRGEG